MAFVSGILGGLVFLLHCAVRRNRAQIAKPLGRSLRRAFVSIARLRGEWDCQARVMLSGDQTQLASARKCRGIHPG